MWQVLPFLCILLLVVDAAPWSFPDQFSLQANGYDRDNAVRVTVFLDKINARALQVDQNTHLWTFCDKTYDLTVEITYDHKNNFCSTSYTPVTSDDLPPCQLRAVNGCSKLFKTKNHNPLLTKVSALKCVADDLTFDKAKTYAYKTSGDPNPSTCTWVLLAYNLTSSPNQDGSYLPFKHVDDSKTLFYFEGRRVCVQLYSNTTFSNLAFQAPSKNDIEVPLQQYCKISSPTNPPPTIPGKLITFQSDYSNFGTSYVMTTDPTSLQKQCIWKANFDFSAQYNFLPVPGTSKFLWAGDKFYSWVDFSTGKSFSRTISNQGLQSIKSYSMAPDGRQFGIITTQKIIYQFFADKDPIQVMSPNITSPYNSMFWSTNGKLLYLVSYDGNYLVTIDAVQWNLISEKKISNTQYAYWDQLSNTIYGSRETQKGVRVLSVIDATTGTPKSGDGTLICTSCTWAPLTSCMITGPQIFSCKSYNSLYHLDMNSGSAYQMGYSSYVGLIFSSGTLYRDNSC